MIARELLVKLGFDIDEGKFKRFTHNVETLKANMMGIKGKIPKLKDQSAPASNLDNLKAVKEQMAKVREQINHRLYPRIDTKQLDAYNKGLKELSRNERSDILALNKLEKATLKDQLHGDRLKYQQLQAVHSKLVETQKGFNAAARTAKAANMKFSRFFTKVALVGSGSFLLALRSTLKDAKDFKEGGGKTNNSFSSKQLDSVNRFNVSLKQLKKTLGELRNKFVIDLLPTFKENLDALNEWLVKNKALINSKVEKFIETLGTAFKILASTFKIVFSALNPLVGLIGGWGVVLSGIIGVGILSWLVRLGLFLSTGATAIKVFAGAIRVLTVALCTNPITLTIMAIVAALALIADEFIVTAKGGDSLMNRFASLKKMGDSFIGTLKEMWQWLVKVGNNMVDFTLGGVGKVKDFFMGDDSQTRPQKPHQMLQNAIAPNSKEPGEFNITYAMKDRYKLTQRVSTNYHNSRSENNNLQTVNSNNKNTFNVNVNVPKGTSEEQSRIIAREVQKQIRTELEFHNEKTLNAIGAI